MLENIFLVEVPEDYQVEVVIKERANKPEKVYLLKGDKPFVIYANSDTLGDEDDEIYICRWPEKDREEWIKEAGKAVLDAIRTNYWSSFFVGEFDEMIYRLVAVHLDDALRVTEGMASGLQEYRQNYEKFEQKSDRELEEEWEFYREDILSAGRYTNGQIKIYSDEKVEATKIYDFMIVGMVMQGKRGIEVVTTEEWGMRARQELLYYLLAAAREENMDVARIAKEWAEFVENPSKFRKAWFDFGEEEDL